jgi:hypothetical protein
MDWNQILKDTEEGSKPIPEGEYDVRIRDANTKTASTGSEMIVVSVVIESGPHAGRVIITNFVFAVANPTAMKMLLRRLTAFGITSEWLAENNPTIAQIAQALVGRTAVAQVNIREWNKELRNDVNMFSPHAGATPTAPAPAVGGASGTPTMPAAPAPVPAGVASDGTALVADAEPF